LHDASRERCADLSAITENPIVAHGVLRLVDASSCREVTTIRGASDAVAAAEIILTIAGRWHEAANIRTTDLARLTE